MAHQKILILDFGSQVSQLIARRVREQQVYCELHPFDVSDEFVRSFGAQGVILSGGPNSVYEAEDWRAPQAVFGPVWAIAAVPRSKTCRTRRSLSKSPPPASAKAMSTTYKSPKKRPTTARSERS